MITKPVKMKVILECPVCGATMTTSGRYIYHRKYGTTSFQAYNVVTECVYCEMEARKNTQK